MGVRARFEIRVPFVLVLLAGTLALGVAPAGAQSVVPAPPGTIDGPSPDIVRLGGLSIARDGSGALVYLRRIAGIEHVFVSRLVGGVFQPPERVDAGLSGASSEPVIAVGPGGLLLIAFINSQQLYVTDRSSAATSYDPPVVLFAGAMHPALQITNLGKAYLVFTADAGSGNHDVRSAYYYRGSWALGATPLNVSPADDAGTGLGRPRVAAAGDGVAIVAWGEGGHIYSRRVWATSPSIVYQQADVALAGCRELSADEPDIAAGGDSSYADVVVHERLSCGQAAQSRVLLRRLVASQYGDAVQVDGMSTPAAEGADRPRVVMAEYGNGLITSTRTSSNQLYATLLGSQGASVGTMPVDSTQNLGDPYGVPAIAGLYADLIAWQQNPPAGGAPEIRARYSQDGSSFDPALVLSTPDLGPADAGRGLAASGDITGDAAVAWVQGTGSSTRIVARQLYSSPGAFRPRRHFAYSRTNLPVLRWTASLERWGQLRYLLSVDGKQVGQSTSTSLQVPAALADGPHSWLVTAANAAGEGRASRSAIVWVDTVPPVGRISVTGARQAGAVLHLLTTYSDSAPGGSSAQGSGVASVRADWGDGSIGRIRHSKFHVYGRPGRYTVTVTITDRAGNSTRLFCHLSIAHRHRARRRTSAHARVQGP